MPTPVFPIHEIPNYNKDPNDVLDYPINWATHLGVDTISTSAWSLDSDNPDTVLVIDSDTKTTTVTIVWLSAGTMDKVYLVTNRIVSANGRTLDQSIRIKMVKK